MRAVEGRRPRARRGRRSFDFNVRARGLRLCPARAPHGARVRRLGRPLAPSTSAASRLRSASRGSCPAWREDALARPCRPRARRTALSAFEREALRARSRRREDSRAALACGDGGRRSREPTLDVAPCMRRATQFPAMRGACVSLRMPAAVGRHGVGAFPCRAEWRARSRCRRGELDARARGAFGADTTRRGDTSRARERTRQGELPSVSCSTRRVRR